MIPKTNTEDSTTAAETLPALPPVPFLLMRFKVDDADVWERGKLPIKKEEVEDDDNIIDLTGPEEEPESYHFEYPTPPLSPEPSPKKEGFPGLTGYFCGECGEHVPHKWEEDPTHRFSHCERCGSSSKVSMKCEMLGESFDNMRSLQNYLTDRWTEKKRKFAELENKHNPLPNRLPVRRRLSMTNQN